MRVAFLHVEGIKGSSAVNAALAENMVRSVKRAIPSAEIIQLTNFKTPTVPGVDTVLRKSPWHPGLMVYRMDTLRDIPDGELIVLDTDVLVREDLSEVFAQPFDVALTKRTHRIMVDGIDVAKDMPYNTGVMFSRKQAFWQDCYDMTLEMSAECQTWFGDQLAVRMVADEGKYQVLELPCEVWNWSPKTSTESVEGRKAVHYKGERRKPWMAEDTHRILT